MDINQETRERIVSAANQLYEQAGRLDFPTVDAVRRVSKTNMNDASAVMKEWRRMQTATAAPVAVAVPDRVQQASQAAIAALWSEAQGIATEALHAAQADWEKERAEAETLRGELSARFMELLETPWLEQPSAGFLEAFDIAVLRLVRVQIGPVALGNLPKGKWRELTKNEMMKLRGTVASSR